MYPKYTLGLMLLLLPLSVRAQETDADVGSEPAAVAFKPAAGASEPAVGDPAVAPVVEAALPVDATPLSAAAPALAERDASWKKLPMNIIQDQRTIWLSPLKLKERKYWVPTAALLGVTAGLVALDPKEGHYFRNTHFYDPYNNVFSGRNTELLTMIVPIGLYGAGLIGGDSKMKSTALLAGEAVLDSEIVAELAKAIDRRKRPQDQPANGNFTDTWFSNKAGGVQSTGSFPSGHTIAAFSVATVIAHRYGNHKWAPYVAYGTAALIGFSRMTLSSHWGSDVFVGGVLGYTISRFSVLHE